MKTAITIAKELNQEDREIFLSLYAKKSRDEGLAFAFAWLLLDRAYMGQIFFNILKIVLCFFLVGFIWVIYDLMTVGNRLEDVNNEVAEDIKKQLSQQAK